MDETFEGVEDVLPYFLFWVVAPRAEVIDETGIGK